MGLGNMSHWLLRMFMVACASTVFMIITYGVPNTHLSWKAVREPGRGQIHRLIKKSERPLAGVGRTFAPKNASHFPTNKEHWTMAPSTSEKVFKTPAWTIPVPKLQRGEAQFPKKTKAVIIVAGYRTGSSFIGDFFNQHPNVFYLFEPLFYDIWRKNATVHAMVLRDLLHCNMTSLLNENRDASVKAMERYTKFRTYKTKKLYRDTRVCLKQNLCFRFKSRAACVPQMCRNDSAETCFDCLPASVAMLEQSCKKAPFHAIKVIRLTDLSVLKRVWADPNIELKIIHLVRDPRSTAVSRMRIKKDGDFAQAVRVTCEKNFKNHEFYLRQEDSSWLRGNYRLLRYEDAISNPFGMLQDLYEFAGFPLHANVLRWMEKSTTSSDHYMYGTSRNSEIQAYKWRKLIPLKHAIDVQEVCEKSMSMFGYIPTTSDRQLRNISHSLLRTMS